MQYSFYRISFKDILLKLVSGQVLSSVCCRLPDLVLILGKNRDDSLRGLTSPWFFMWSVLNLNRYEDALKPVLSCFSGEFKSLL